MFNFRTRSNDFYTHSYFLTPAQLISDVREKVFGDREVTITLKAYQRLEPNKTVDYDYYDNKGSPVYIKGGDALSFFKSIHHYSDRKIGKKRELAFTGFKVHSNEPLDCFEFFDDFTHDMPRCDMKFSADLLETEPVKTVLTEMKVFCNGADLYLYKTTNSFHVYMGTIMAHDDISHWRSVLRKLDCRFPGVIDRKWLQMNSMEQPLRITETDNRELPTLVCVI